MAETDPKYKWDNPYTITFDDYNSIVISYIDLMMAAGVYIQQNVDELDDGLSKDPNNITIENTALFDAIVYYTAWRNGQKVDISVDNYDITKVSKYFMDKDVKDQESIGLYNQNELTFSINPENLTDLEILADLHPDQANIYNDEYEISELDAIEIEAFKKSRLLNEGDSTFFYISVYYPGPANIEGDGEPIESEKTGWYKICIEAKYEKRKDDKADEESPSNGDMDAPVDFDVNQNYESDVEYYATPDLDELASQIGVDNLKYIYMNAMNVYDIRTKSNNILYCLDNFLQVYVNPICPKAFSFTVYMYKTGDTSGVPYAVYVYHYTPGTINVTSSDFERVQKMNNPDVSYSLLRANPKLTGNIKLVVDSSSNMYLDTFKISDALSQKRYRHVKVGYDTYYGKSVMNTFKDLPSTELYKIADSCYSMFTPAQTYKEQYYDTYNYGVSTNTDDMYNENYSILAPLCIKRVMPDFFLIFKVDKSKDAYNETGLSDQEKIQYFLKNGKIVKSYDMRKDSPLGTYIRNIYEMSKEYPGDLFTSYDTENYNKFIGISLDRGVVTPMYESEFAQEKCNNQVALDNYFTTGFERNRIVSKDIVNFEFMFDDPEESLFSINTYFGLYVKLNGQSDTFSCIGSELMYSPEDSSANEVEPTDIVPVVYKYDSEVYSFDENYKLDNHPETSTLIYGVSTPTEFIRLKEGLPYSSINKQFINRPNKNISTIHVTETDKRKVRSFITLKLNDLLDVGDHIKVISTNNHVIYEIIMTDKNNIGEIDGLYVDEYGLTEIIENHYNEYSREYTIFRMSMCIDFKSITEDALSDILDPDERNLAKKNIINEQLGSLYKALEKFNGNIRPLAKEENSISIVCDDDVCVFERICSASGFTSTQAEYLNTTHDEDNTIQFFGNTYVNKLILNIESDSWKRTDLAYLYPIHFEVLGNRMAYAISFIDTLKMSNSEKIYSGNIIDKTALDIKTMLYFAYDKDMNTKPTLYRQITVDQYEVVANVARIKKDPLKYNYVQSFVNLNDSIINVENPVIYNNSISIYDPYPINTGLCSILQIKDYDFGCSTGNYNKKSVFAINGKDYDDEHKEDNDDPDAEYYMYGDPNYIKMLIASIPDLHIFPTPDAGEITYNENSPLYTASAGAIWDEYLRDYFNFAATKCIFKPLICPDADLKRHNYNDLIHIVDTESPFLNAVIEHDPIDDSYILTYANNSNESTNRVSATYTTEYSKYATRNAPEEDLRNYIDLYTDFGTNSEKTNNTFDKLINNDLLSDMFDKNHRKFDVSLTSPYCCSWKSIGSDARGDVMKLMHDFSGIIDENSYFVPNDVSYSTHMGYLNIPDKNTGEFKGNSKYIPKSLYDVVSTSNGRMYEKTCILQGIASLDDILYDAYDYNNKFTRVYRSGTNTIEFISAGLKFRIKSNNSNVLNLSNYNGYSAVFVTLPVPNTDYHKELELIIDETKNEIMLVWYKPSNTYKMGYKVKSVNDSTLNSKGGYRTVLPINFDIMNIHSGGTIIDNIYKKNFFTAIIPDSGGLCNVKEEYEHAQPDTNVNESRIVNSVYKQCEHFGKRLCDKMAYVWIPAITIDEDVYSKYESFAVYGKIFDQRPVSKSLENTFPYYDQGGLKIIAATTWYDVTNSYFSDANMEQASPKIGPTYNSYLFTDTIDYVYPITNTYQELKDACSSYAVFLKTDNGKKDFTNISSLLEISVIDPVVYVQDVKKYAVHSTYGEPIMKDILVFDYNSNMIGRDNKITKAKGDVVKTIEDIFHKSFDGANIGISNVNTLTDIWINKYSEEDNYCFTTTTKTINGKRVVVPKYKLSVDKLDKVSIMNDSWSFDTYRIYNSSNDNSYSTVKGYTTGYEMKTYINSKAIAMKGKIEIVSWKNTEISKENGYIRLNITDSLVYNILFNDNFDSAWKNLPKHSNDYKIKYIKNTILENIHINNKTKFILGRKKDEDDILEKKQTNIDFVSEYNAEDCIEISNYKNELKHINGEYYMYIYPDDIKTYYAKMIIEL